MKPLVKLLPYVSDVALVLENHSLNFEPVFD